MDAVSSEMEFVQTCSCGKVPVIYRNMWDLLCNQLFAQIVPPGFDSQGNFQDVRIWSEGEVEIVMTKSESPYTFSVKVDGENTPKVNDVILFGKNRFYIIGAVSSGIEANTFTCSGCLAIDISIVGVFAALLALDAQAVPAESARVEAENGRVTAENGRVSAENARVEAESTRDGQFTSSQEQRASAYLEAEGDSTSPVGDGSRWGEFKAAELARTNRLEQIVSVFLTPWIVPGAIGSGGRHFTPDDPNDNVALARTRFYAGKRTYLHVEDYGTEEIIGDDGECLVTRSNWKWRYEQ